MILHVQLNYLIRNQPFHFIFDPDTLKNYILVAIQVTFIPFLFIQFFRIVKKVK